MIKVTLELSVESGYEQNQIQFDFIGKLQGGTVETAFIVNPKSGNGSTGREWPMLRDQAFSKLGPFRESFSERQGHAAVLTRENLRRGIKRIICVGGDGTLNEVVNGFMDENQCIAPDAVLGFLPNGTGCDFARSLHLGRGINDTIETIATGHIKSLDLGRLRYSDDNGVSLIRYFHNIASFGIGGEVVERVNRTSKAAGPFLSFMWATLITILAYEKKEIRLQIDDSFVETFSTWNIAVANGRYHGGGMLVAPDARIDDGLFHVTLIGNLDLVSVFRHLPKLYNGRINEVPQIRTMTGSHVKVTSVGRVLMDVDGEQVGTLPVEADIIPEAIRMIVKE
ncbi:MAG: diacylglycerol kinase family lipid kinase [Syntrophaceae bacterium]|nr:diacylglycerol kinase family lipid kinase [Syntrophaceae bacterium]